MTCTPSPAPAGLPQLLPPAAGPAAEAARLAGRLTDLHDSHYTAHVDVPRVGFAAITHGLLAVAAAVQAGGNDASDALADVSGQLSGLDVRLAEIDGSPGVIAEAACTRFNGSLAWFRWRARRRASRAAAQAAQRPETAAAAAAALERPQPAWASGPPPDSARAGR